MTIGPSTATFFKVQRIIKCRLQEVSKTSNSPIFLSNYYLPFLPSETLHTYFVLPGKSTVSMILQDVINGVTASTGVQRMTMWANVREGKIF